MSEPPAPFEKLQVPLTSLVVGLPEVGPPGHGDPTVSGLPEEGVNVKHVPPSKVLALSAGNPEVNGRVLQEPRLGETFSPSVVAGVAG
jgi:hypothetical protein